MSSVSKSGTILTFVLGVGVGAIAALLFTPQSGDELRAEIADRANDGVKQIRSTGKHLRQQAQKLAEAAADEVQGAVAAGVAAYNNQSNKV